MEYLLVNYYDIKRPVIVDGYHSGYTNEVIELGGGQFSVALGDPPNFPYSPEEQTVILSDTSSAAPHEITFI